MTQQTFTADGTLDERFKTSNSTSEVFIFVGSDVSEDLSGGTLKIQLQSEIGDLITLKEITSLSSPTDRASRFVLPRNMFMDVTLEGSATPDLAVQLETGPYRF